MISIILTVGMDEQGEDELDSNKVKSDPLSDDKDIALENELPYAENYGLKKPEPISPHHTGISLLEKFK